MFKRQVNGKSNFIACPSIDNCLEMHCEDTYSSTICANCDGVVMDQRYYMAYVRSKDQKRCQRK